MTSQNLIETFVALPLRAFWLNVFIICILLFWYLLVRVNYWYNFNGIFSIIEEIILNILPKSEWTGGLLWLKLAWLYRKIGSYFIYLDINFNFGITFCKKWKKWCFCYTNFMFFFFLLQLYLNLPKMSSFK